MFFSDIESFEHFFKQQLTNRTLESTTCAKGAAAPVNLGQRVHAPVNFQAWYYIQTILSDFSANSQILHPSIEIFKPDTTF